MLADFGVWLLDDRRRLKLAGELAADGCAPKALELLCGFVERQAGHDPEMTGKRLAMILRPGVWQRTHETARKAEGRKAKAATAPARGEHDQGETRRAEQDAQRERERENDPQRLAGLAYTMLQYDGKSPREVANALKVGVDRLPALVRPGAVIYGVDPDQAVDRLLMKAGAR